MIQHTAAASPASEYQINELTHHRRTSREEKPRSSLCSGTNQSVQSPADSAAGGESFSNVPQRSER